MSNSNTAVIQSLCKFLRVNSVIWADCDNYGVSRNARSKFSFFNINCCFFL